MTGVPVAMVQAERAPAAARPRAHGHRSLRRQLPVYSPLTAAALFRSAQAIGREGGPTLRSLAGLLEARHPAQQTILCASGTAALTLALRLVTRARGERIVAVPAYACFDIATAVVGADLECVAYDIDPSTLGPDPSSFQEALRSAGAAVVAPIYGVPLDWAMIRSIASASGATVIEDAAQGHGALWRNLRVGDLGDCTVLSFGRGKGWTAGSGGALLVRDPALVARVQDVSLPVPGTMTELGILVRSAVQWLFGRPLLYSLPSSMPALGLGETRYKPPVPLESMARGAAATALATVAAADAELETRRANGEYYERALAGLAGIGIPHAPADSRPGYLRFAILRAGGLSGLTDAVAARDLGAGPPYPVPLLELPALKASLARDVRTVWPGAHELVRNLLTLPTHSAVTARDRKAIVNLIATSTITHG